MRAPRGERITVEEAAKLQGLVLERGLAGAAYLIGLSTSTFARACCLAELHRDSAAQIRRALARRGVRAPASCVIAGVKS